MLKAKLHVGGTLLSGTRWDHFQKQRIVDANTSSQPDYGGR